MNAEETALRPWALDWHKSSHSGAEGGQCVEVAASSEAVYVRDSKDKTGPALSFGSVSWAEFLSFTTDLMVGQQL
jgi:hypothetical protein